MAGILNKAHKLIFSFHNWLFEEYIDLNLMPGGVATVCNSSEGKSMELPFELSWPRFLCLTNMPYARQPSVYVSFRKGGVKFR